MADGGAAGSLPAMTEELAQVDAYAAECPAMVEEVEDGAMVLDRTVFYARSGGQPGDTGTIEGPGGQVRVVDTVKREGRVLHLVETGDLPAPGDRVTAKIDWERRYLLMRTHTALHVLSAVIWSEFGAKVTGGNMEPGSARMDFELDGITVELGRRVEERLNEVLAEGHPVTIRFMPRAEALADPDLIRTKVNLIPEHVDPIRVVEIGTVDKQADGGTHVADTSEVGTVRVTKTESKGAGNKRMRIEVQP
jgi:misacylated tRNA(Ala) deacylase